MARQAPEGLLGIHLNLLSAFPTTSGRRSLAVCCRRDSSSGLAIAVLAARAEKKEPEALDALAALFRRGYFVEMPEHPQTIGYALTDTPVGLAAWMLDHDADSYEKISRAFSTDSLTGGLTPGQVRRQHHAVLADEYRRLVGAAVLGELPSHLRGARVRGKAAEPFGPGGVHRLPRRDLPGAAQLGREGLSQPDLLQ